ncbi:unnamed protein product [Larinioides sclopetarius]|uniref:Reverse transcriptase zinc-binding domain-containing protein n=1 Tax=Larinioides sclopetarius TaxID=280406 RepID=A0AAV2A6D8_9ARAC
MDRLRGYIISYLKAQSTRITSENYCKSKYYAQLGNIPDIPSLSKWTKYRTQDRLIARIISRTIITPGLLFKFNLHPTPVCIVCNEINDISHILLTCKKYASYRTILWNKLNIIEPTITYDILLSHIFNNRKHLICFLQSQVLRYILAASFWQLALRQFVFILLCV